MDIVRVLALLNKHILDLETNIQYKEWEINNLRKEIEQLKNNHDEK